MEIPLLCICCCTVQMLVQWLIEQKVDPEISRIKSACVLHLLARLRELSQGRQRQTQLDKRPCTLRQALCCVLQHFRCFSKSSGRSQSFALIKECPCLLVGCAPDFCE